MYVKDRVLFVEDGIHLEKNQNEETAAGIYFRKEGQLIQGVKTFNNNSGNGFISIFQEGTANAFNFNYWSLPVSLHSEIKKFNDYIWEPLSRTQSRRAKITRAHEGKANPLEISSRWIYKFSGGEYDDWEFLGNNMDLLPGEGFTMKGVLGRNDLEIEGVKNNPGNRQRYDFRGLPNNGDISIPIKFGEILLTGNPYPSALNLKQFLTENTATTGIAYFWDYSNKVTSHYLEDYEGGYGAYSPGANTYAPAVFKTYDQNGDEVENTGETGAAYAREHSPIGQGFMVMGNENGNVIFKNSQREFVQENAQTSQFRSRENLISKLKLNIDFNELYTRQLIVAFREDATPGADHAMDAKSFGPLASDAAWIIEDEPFLINVLPFKKEQKLPIAISLEKKGTIKISIDKEKNSPAEKIYLFDKNENLYHNLSSKFFTELPAGNYNNRFFLAFTREKEVSAPVENIPEAEDLTGEEIMVSYDEKLHQVEVLAKDFLDQIELYDLSGGLILTKRIYDNQQYYYFYTGKLKEAVYIIRIKTRKNSHFNTKIILKK